MDRIVLARLGLAAALLWTFPGVASGQLEEKRRDLIRIQKEYEKVKSDLDEYRRQESALNRDLHKLESHDADTRRRIGGIRRNIHEAEQRRVGLRSHLGALNLASGFWTAARDRELRAYVVALAAREEAWGGADLWAEAFRRAVLLDKARIVSSLLGYRHKTEAAVEAARHSAVELRGRSRRAEAEAAQVREEYGRKQAAVAAARGQVQAAEKRARELEETKRALTELLSRLGAAKRYDRQGPTRLELPRNSLPWPVDGTVARPFGRQRNAELNTWVIRQGVTFATKPGAPVGAVGAGRVIYSGPFRSYGKVVIVDHGGGFFSIYGELGDIQKAKGAPVEVGEAVGTAGGEAGKGVVYLELRRGTEALDPMSWLQKKS
ncbi:MAG: peptidoglycan DD-metalloendopeptidase family protein [Elusimicrobia bacterium]|nr:peptidoglycan DD-metalloendopeptidase family protein [Elusimicrobiota bacterium]